MKSLPQPKQKPKPPAPAPKPAKPAKVKKVKPKPKRKPKPPKTKRKKTSAESDNTGRSTDNLLAMFRSLDRNHDHKLSRKELKPLARRLKMDSKTLFKMMDNDGNGSVDFAEFKAYMSAK